MSDVADVGFAYAEPTARLRFRGEPSLAFNIVREQGANVIATMAEVKSVLAELEAGPVAEAGLVMEQVYDETVYIEGAIDLVTQNIWIGGLLAAGILLIFLRSPRATLVISLAIPVSIVATFVAMAATGRTLNVISLAGIAFAVGMVVDAAIVVLENIYRLRQRGLSRREAAYQGAGQVWGAVFVSARGDGATSVTVDNKGDIGGTANSSRRSALSDPTDAQVIENVTNGRVSLDCAYLEAPTLTEGLPSDSNELDAFVQVGTTARVLTTDLASTNESPVSLTDHTCMLSYPGGGTIANVEHSNTVTLGLIEDADNSDAVGD
mgnify:CR=1 FL=1